MRTMRSRLGTIDAAAVLSLSQLVRGEYDRVTSSTPTLYKSVGSATQDVALAHSLLKALDSEAGDRGTPLPDFPAVKSAR